DESIRRASTVVRRPNLASPCAEIEFPGTSVPPLPRLRSMTRILAPTAARRARGMRSARPQMQRSEVGDWSLGLFYLPATRAGTPRLVRIARPGQGLARSGKVDP